MKKNIIFSFLVLLCIDSIKAQTLELKSFKREKISSLDYPNRKHWVLKVRIKNNTNDTLIILKDSIKVFLGNENLQKKEFIPNFGTPYLPPDGYLKNYLNDNKIVYNQEKINFLVGKIRKCRLNKDAEEILNDVFNFMYFSKKVLIVLPNEFIEEKKFYKSMWFRKNKLNVIIQKTKNYKVPIYFKKEERILDLNTCIFE